MNPKPARPWCLCGHSETDDQLGSVLAGFKGTVARLFSIMTHFHDQKLALTGSSNFHIRAGGASVQAEAIEAASAALAAACQMRAMSTYEMRAGSSANLRQVELQARRCDPRCEKVPISFGTCSSENMPFHSGQHL